MRLQRRNLKTKFTEIKSRDTVYQVAVSIHHTPINNNNMFMALLFMALLWLPVVQLSTVLIHLTLVIVV